MRLAAPLVLVVTLAGCTLIEAYPTEPENCSNHIDDDFDGATDCEDHDSCARDDACREATHCFDRVDQDLDTLVDCSDPDCVGQCPEQDRNACANGRDDDGDGRVDLADPRCWPYGVVRLERCPSVRGHDQIYDRLDLFSAFDLGLGEVPDPEDALHTVIGSSTSGTVASARAREIEGVWDGTTFEGRVYLAGAGAAVVTLGPMQLSLTRTLARISVEETNDSRSLAPAVPDGWWSVRIQAAATDVSGHVAITLSATPPGGALLADVTLVPSHAWPASGELGLELRAVVGASGAVFFDASHVQRHSGVSCYGGPGSVPGAVISAATIPGVGSCVSGFDETGTVQSWVMEERFVLAAAQPSLPAGIALAPAMAVAEDASTLHGVALRGDGSLLLLRGQDCATWMELGDPFTTAPSTLLPAVPPGADTPTPRVPGYGLSYVVRRPQATGPIQHEIAVAGRNDLGVRGMLFATSASGEPGSFQISSFRSLEQVVDSDGTERWRSQVSVASIGADHVYLVGRSEWLAPGVISDVLRVLVDVEGSGSAGGATGFFDLDEASVVPSGFPGALDAANGISAGVLVEAVPPPHGFRAYILDRNAEPGTVTDVATLTVLPPTACANPMPEVCNMIDDDCNGIVDDLGPELCDGLDSDCDGVDDSIDPDATAGCPRVSSPFHGASCGRVLVGSTSHAVDIERFGCVENYDLELAGSGGGTTGGQCDTGYALCEDPARGCESTASDCYWVICAQRGCP